jgi:hypothetical protein
MRVGVSSTPPDVKRGDRTMRLSAPSFIVFLLSVICAVLALLPVFGIAVVALPISTFWLMTLAWGLMTAGVLFRGM